MIKKTFHFAYIGLMVLGSCTIPGKISGIYKSRTNKTANIQRSSITAYPIIVDLAVDLTTKVNGTSSGEIANGLTEDYFRELALSDAIVKSGADVLVEPIFNITKNFSGTGADLTTNIEVSVTGYIGKYKNPRNISAADTSMIQFVRSNSVQDNLAPKTNTIQLMSTGTKVY